MMYDEMIIRRYDDEEAEAIEIVEHMIENEDYVHLKCVLMDIINRHHDSDVIGLIRDYDYLMC